MHGLIEQSKCRKPFLKAKSRSIIRLWQIYNINIKEWAVIYAL